MLPSRYYLKDVPVAAIVDQLKLPFTFLIACPAFGEADALFPDHNVEAEMLGR